MRQSRPARSRASTAADAPPLVLPDVLQFMRLLWAVVHGLGRASKRMNQELGVTGPQRLVLRVVGLFPGVSAGELAVILHVHPSTLTGILQRLVTQRLLIRDAAPVDRRRAVLRLTPRGALVNRRTDGTVEAIVGSVLRGTTDRQRVATREVLTLLADHLEVPSTIGARLLREPRNARSDSRGTRAPRHSRIGTSPQRDGRSGARGGNRIRAR